MYLGESSVIQVGDTVLLKSGYNIRKTPGGDKEGITGDNWIRVIVGANDTWYRIIEGWISIEGIKEVVQRIAIPTEQKNVPWWEALSKSIGNAIGGVNVNVPATVDVKTPKSIELDIFASMKRNILPITVGALVLTSLVIGVAYATKRRT